MRDRAHSRTKPLFPAFQVAMRAHCPAAGAGRRGILSEQRHQNPVLAHEAICMYIVYL